jgi:hypothetical protein
MCFNFFNLFFDKGPVINNGGGAVVEKKGAASTIFS